MAALFAARAAPVLGARPAAVQRTRAATSAGARRGAPARAQLHLAHGDAAQPSRREAVLGAALLGVAAFAPPSRAAGEANVYDFTVMQYGKPVSLDKYRGKNRNYPAFRELYTKYHDQGFEIIAFPANQFGGQAPGTDEEERAWALKKFGIDFDVFDHVAVLDKPTPMWEGPTEISPLYRYMKSVLPGEIPWNYTKFLIGRDGVPLRRYSPADPLDQGMEADVVAALAGKPLRKRRSER